MSKPELPSTEGFETPEDIERWRAGIPYKEAHNAPNGQDCPSCGCWVYEGQSWCSNQACRRHFATPTEPVTEDANPPHRKPPSQFAPAEVHVTYWKETARLAIDAFYAADRARLDAVDSVTALTVERDVLQTQVTDLRALVQRAYDIAHDVSEWMSDAEEALEMSTPMTREQWKQTVEELKP